MQLIALERAAHSGRNQRVANVKRRSNMKSPKTKTSGEKKVEKTVSPRRIEANRRNALRSTGPKTPEGKRMVRWNALKHGLLAKEVVIGAGEGEESQAEFENLLAQLRAEWQPEGIREEMLVEKMAVSYWRHRRALRCEMGEIRKAVDTARYREYVRLVEQVRSEVRQLTMEDREHALRKTSRGIRYLLGVLEDVRQEVEEVGHLPREAAKRLVENFGGEEYGLAYGCLLYTQVAATESQEKAFTPEQCKEDILELIDEEKQQLQAKEEFLEGIERLELEAKVSSLALPAGHAVDKFLRYETAIEREGYRAMSELERLQRQRKGEAVPPPLSVDLSSDH